MSDRDLCASCGNVFPEGQLCSNCAPPTVWIAWKTALFTVGRSIVLLTSSEDRAVRLAATSPNLVAESVKVEGSEPE